MVECLLKFKSADLNLPPTYYADGTQGPTRIHFYGNKEAGYSGQSNKGEAEVVRKADGLWYASFWGNPPNGHSGLCLRYKLVQGFKTRKSCGIAGILAQREVRGR